MRQVEYSIQLQCVVLNCSGVPLKVINAMYLKSGDFSTISNDFRTFRVKNSELKVFPPLKKKMMVLECGNILPAAKQVKIKWREGMVETLLHILCLPSILPASAVLS